MSVFKGMLKVTYLGDWSVVVMASRTDAGDSLGILHFMMSNLLDAG